MSRRGRTRLGPWAVGTMLLAAQVSLAACQDGGGGSAAVARPEVEADLVDAPVAASVAPVGRTRLRVEVEPAGVGIVGDSITTLSQGDVERSLRGYRLAISAAAGDRVVDQTPSAEVVVAAEPEVVIVELGTNDAAQRNERVVADLRRLAVVLEDTPCVVWYTVSEYPTNEGLVSIEINRELRRLDRAHANFHLTDWNQILGTWPGFLLPSDSVHPNPQGRRLLASLYAQDVEDTCGYPPVTSSPDA